MYAAIAAAGEFVSGQSAAMRSNSRQTILRLARYAGFSEIEKQLRGLLQQQQYLAVKKILDAGVNQSLKIGTSSLGGGGGRKHGQAQAKTQEIAMEIEMERQRQRQRQREDMKQEASGSLQSERAVATLIVRQAGQTRARQQVVVQVCVVLTVCCRRCYGVLLVVSGAGAHRHVSSPPQSASQGV